MSNIVQKIKKGLNNHQLIVSEMNRRGLLKFLSDEQWVRLMYRIRIGKKLNLENPQTFNEKVLWLKLYGRNPAYTNYVDKYEVKKIVADLVGEEYVVPLLGVYDNFDEIDFDSLPDQFVIKTTHDSGGYVICKNKLELDINAARKKIESCLKRNYYYSSREWPYKNVKPRIIVEKYIVGADGTEMKDYKFFCFNGEPKFGFQVEGRTSEKMKIGFYDTDFNQIPVKQGGDKYEIAEKLVRPHNLEKMLELSKILTKGIPFVRMDFIEVDDRLYVGEFTFYHWGGTMKFEPEEYDRKFGEYLVLPEKKL